MTPDELEAAVLGGDPQLVIALVGSATEPERLACGARMAALRKAHGDWRPPATATGANETSLLALLGTGSAAQIAAGRRMWRAEAAGAVLRLRPPPLLEALVPWMLDRMGWPLVRSLVRDGVIPRPSGDAYIAAMLDGFADADALLRDDPALLDHEVWRLFEVEGTPDHSLADHDKYSAEPRTWSYALLARSGHALDRDRLLDASLGALERDFPAFRAGWYGRFHEALAPTPGERAARVGAYLRLLRSPIGATVTLAVRALAVVREGGGLDGARLLAAVEPAMSARSAGTAREGLRLVEAVLREDPALAPLAARPVVAALGHASADVQAAAIELLASGRVPVDREVGDALEARRNDVAASLRPRLDSLLGGAAARAVARTEAPSTAASTALANPPAPADPFSALEPLVRVASVEGLVELLAAVLEQEGPPERLELALDGVARFPRDPSAAFERTTRAVRVRAARVLRGRRGPGIATWFAALIVAWVDGTPPDEPPAERGRVTDYLRLRVHEVAGVAAAGRPRTIVALPSYAGGWIDPGDLVARLAGQPRDEDLPLDVIQALLRVLPLRREPALAAASTLEGEVGDAVRHALGGDAPVGPTPALWAAAARCRTGDADDPAVAAVHPFLGADAALAGHYRLVVAQGRFMRLPVVDAGVRAPEPRVDVPTDLLWRVTAHVAGGGDERALVDWMRLIWPQDRRSWFAVSAALFLGNIDWWEARWHDRARLEPLFEPWTLLGAEAAALLAVALQAKEPGQRGLAIDAAIAAIEQERLPAESLIDAFDAVATALEGQEPTAYPITLFRPGRLASSLEEIARRSDRHGAWALEVAAGALARVVATTRPKPVPRGQLTPVLRLLIELSAASPTPVPAVATPALQAIAGGSGDGARLARMLLAGSTPP